MPGRWYSTNAANPRGSYTYNGTYTGVTGLGGPAGSAARTSSPWARYRVADTATTNNMASAAISTFAYTHFVQKYMAGYVQDDWKMTPKLTLNVGLRYEYFTPKREQADQLANFVWRVAPSPRTARVGTFGVRDAGKPEEPTRFRPTSWRCSMRITCRWSTPITPICRPSPRPTGRRDLALPTSSTPGRWGASAAASSWAALSRAAALPIC